MFLLLVRHIELLTEFAQTGQTLTTNIELLAEFSQQTIRKFNLLSDRAIG